jgi:mRNA interferase RelE/StbE
MEIRFKKQFLKDLALIPTNHRLKIESLVFEEIPSADSGRILEIVSKMKGYEGYYKIRVGDFRIGLCFTKNVLEFQRVLHRKDIYRFFP